MRLTDARIVLTGASGGLGAALASQLARAGAAVLLSARDGGRLARIAMPAGCEYHTLATELTTEEGVARLTAAAREFRANALINNAGVGGFGLLEEQDWGTVEHVIATNLSAPVRLTQALLPLLRAQRSALVVNIGSAFGSLPFAGFAAYSAAKGGLHAFSQALRRELADSSVRVLHVSPRAIDTPLNSPAVRALNHALGNASDRPEAVARRIVRMIEGGAVERHIGFPERLFAWLNGVAPGLIDQGLRGKLPTIKQHARSRRDGL